MADRWTFPEEKIPDDPRDLLKYKHFIRNFFDSPTREPHDKCWVTHSTLKNIPYINIKGLWRENLNDNLWGFIDIFNDTIGDASIQNPATLKWTQAMRIYNKEHGCDKEDPWCNESWISDHPPRLPPGFRSSLRCLFIGHIFAQIKHEYYKLKFSSEFLM